MICLEKDKLATLLRREMLEMFDNNLKERNLKVSDLAGRADLMEIITSNASEKLSRDNHRIEVFAAWSIFLCFYPDGGYICFDLKSSANTSITSLDDLINATKENTLTDFAILTQDGIRKFQLKRYKEPTIDVPSLLSFIKEKIGRYGDIGDTNLLIVLQSEDPVDIGTVNFADLYERLNAQGYSFDGEILITYNEENKFSVINQVYPRLTTSRVAVDWTE